MKFYSLLFFLLTVGCASSATVRTVSNHPNSPGQYTTVAAAIAASAIGDTIYLHGTEINYGNFSFNKQLTFIGSSHNPQNQNTSRSIVGTITLQAGSGGSRIIGLVLGRVENGSAATPNVTVSRNYITDQLYITGNSGSWQVESNIFVSTSTNINHNLAGGCTNWVVVKNVFNGYVQNFSGSGNALYNNLFLRNGDCFSGMYNTNVYNNIFYRANPGGGLGSGMVFNRNLSYQCFDNNFPSGTNLTGVNPLFVNFPGAGAFFAYTHNYRLQPGSPCLGYGIDAEDIGPHGGSIGKYEQNGVPTIPQIRAFTLTSSTTVPVGGTISANVKSTIRP
jgi:hypothetical protein